MDYNAQPLEQPHSDRDPAPLQSINLSRHP